MRPFVLALALSIAVHLWLLFTPRIHFSFDAPADTPVIEARLVNPPPPAVVAAAKHKRPARPKRPLPEPPAMPPPQPTPAPETAAPPVEEAAAPPEPAQPEEEAPAEAPQAAPPEPASHMPALAEIEFALHKGENGLKVGRVVHKWQIVNDGYVISSVTEATGIFSWIKPGRLVQTSQGKLSARGLEPDYFWIQRGQSADTTESAQFDRKNNTLTYGAGAERRAVPLPDQAQDLLSFVYQLAFNAPQSGAIQLFITNGRKLDHYDYGVVNEETLDTPLGKLKTLHLRKIRSAGEDGVDIWLGVDYRYLPVKVRLTDKNGGSIEQVASEVRLQ